MMTYHELEFQAHISMEFESKWNVNQNAMIFKQDNTFECVFK